VSIKEMENQKNLKKRILWASFLVLDVHFHKTSRLEVLKNLARKGHNVSLLAVRSGEASRIDDSELNIILVPLRYFPILSPVMFAVVLFVFLPFYVMISKPHYIITEPDFSIFGFASVIPFSKLKKTKLILDVRSTPVETTDFRGLLRALCFTMSVLIAKRFFDGMTIITPLMKEEVCKKFSIDPKFVGTWSSGVSTTLFNPDSYVSDGKELKRKLGLSKKFVVFYHGAFSANRGLTETIKAMSIVKRFRSDIVLFLLGTGPIADNLKNLIRMNNLQDNVVIHSPVDYVDVPKYIAMSDVGVVPLPNHPYWKHQCPLNLLEYLAMGKVVIATDIPANRLVIGERECGIYLSSVKPIDIAKAIEYAYHNKEQLKEQGATGRAIITEKYTWEKVATDLENYLLSVDDTVKFTANYGRE